jgi:hypothetical protein
MLLVLRKRERKWYRRIPMRNWLLFGVFLVHRSLHEESKKRRKTGLNARKLGLKMLQRR